MMNTFREWRAEAEKAKVLKGWTIRQVADVAGYDYKYVLNVMGGRQIGQPCMDAISIALGIESYRYRPEDLSLIRETR